jgi:O-antigen/teichoic acid export membrane protein
MRINSTQEPRNPIASRLISFWNRLDHHMREVIEGASVAFVMRLGGAGLAFGFNVLLARMLGAEGAGLYYLALAVTTIATVFGRVGLDNALLRFVAANASVGEWTSVKGVYKKGMKMALGFSALVATVTFAAAPWLAATVFSKPELTVPIRWMSMAVVPMAMVFLHAELLKGLKRIRDSLLVNCVGLHALSLIGLYLMGRAFGVTGAVWAYICATVFMALAGYYLWRSSTPQLRDIEGRFDTRKLLRSAMPLFWVAAMNLVMMWTSTFMLGMWSTSEAVGIFNVAFRTAMLTSFVLVAVNSISAPKFAALYRQGDIEALGSIARNSAKLMTLMASPVLLLFVLAPGWIMGIFGPQFVDGGTVLAIITLGQFVNVATGSVGYLLMMSGHEHLMRNIVAVVAFTCIFLNALLIPHFGVTGGAVATATCLSLQNLLASFYVYKAISIKVIPWPYFKRR